MDVKHLNNKKNKKILSKNHSLEKYINNIKKTSFKSVILKLHGKLRKKNISEGEKKRLKKDIELLKIWRKDNPNSNFNIKIEKPIKNKEIIKQINLKSEFINNFKKNLNNDFKKKKFNQNHLSKNNNIKELTNKDIIKLINNQ